MILQNLKASVAKTLGAEAAIKLQAIIDGPASTNDLVEFMELQGEFNFAILEFAVELQAGAQTEDKQKAFERVMAALRATIDHRAVYPSRLIDRSGLGMGEQAMRDYIASNKEAE